MLNRLISLILFAVSVQAQANALLPERSSRAAILQELVDKIAGYDGEALLVRENRDDSWGATARQLVDEGTNATSLHDFVRSLSRIDQSYPNLHSSFRVIDEEIGDALPGHIVPAVRFVEVRPDENRVEFVISQIDQEFPADADGFAPQLGDKLVAINGRPMTSWLDEQFSFCKWPLKSQCGLTMFRNLTREYLSWRRSDGLTYSIERKGRISHFEVELLDYQSSPRDYSKYLCGSFPERYGDFELKYVGNRACIFESPDYPGVAVLRITSFQYHRGRNEDPPVCGGDENRPIENIFDEVDCLREHYWHHADRWEHLVIDVLDNGGGQSPIPYYQILFTGPFQEQWVMFRKNQILEDDTLRAGVFWGSEGQELWYQQLRSRGVWDATAEGDFLPRIPMFCADESRPCDQGRFEPIDHLFRGKITLLVNELCVSSCDGFVYELKDELGEGVRLVGSPQAADTAYSRVAFDILKTPVDGEFIKLRPLYADASEGAMFTQTISVTRSVTEEGRVVSGLPEPVDLFVPYSYDERINYPDKVLKAALFR